MVALISRLSSPPKYFCGGVLVSTNKVITAAHCLWNKGVPTRMHERDVFVRLGVYDLDDLHELDTAAKAVYKIIIHDQWNPTTKRFNDDIAIILFEYDVPITQYVRPICIADIEAVRNSDNGITAGWGQTEDKTKNYENIARHTKLPIPKNDDCYRAHYLLANIASKKSFCAGERNVSAVCLGL